MMTLDKATLTVRHHAQLTGRHRLTLRAAAGLVLSDHSVAEADRLLAQQALDRLNDSKRIFQGAIS